MFLKIKNSEIVLIFYTMYKFLQCVFVYFFLKADIGEYNNQHT